MHQLYPKSYNKGAIKFLISAKVPGRKSRLQTQKQYTHHSKTNTCFLKCSESNDIIKMC